ncbi:MAG: FHIPEP family type III secretion protein [Myxococcota bacterium]|jgi:type III secretion protein V|nr:FHIPEP family type III secretion protein [Myxococcota bacterium]
MSAPSIHRRLPLPSEAVLAVGICAIVLVLLIPMPFWAIDLMLAANLAFAFTLFAMALSLRGANAAAAFPALLVLATLLRLSLNVATARSILSAAHAGQVIEAFAQWTAAGSLAVGLVLFIVLSIAQLVVVTKGGERVAEVAARFALDALPGRQNGIDAEQRYGRMSATEASLARAQLMHESQVLGALDGAMKFVRGDAWLGLCVLLSNALAGVSVGILVFDMDPSTALQHFGMLTIGDALVIQIPGLLSAISATLVATRVTSEHTQRPSLAAQLLGQFSQHPQALAAAALLLALLALLPALPAAPFLILATCTAALAAWSQHQARSSAPPSTTLELCLPAESSHASETLAPLFAQLQQRLCMPSLNCRCHRDEATQSLTFVLDGRRLAELPAEADISSIEYMLERLTPKLLELAQVEALLDTLAREHRRLHSALLERFSAMELKSLLSALLAERLPIHPFDQVIEMVLDAGQGLSQEEYIENVRSGLTCMLLPRLRDNAFQFIALGPRLGLALSLSLRRDGSLNLDDEMRQDLRSLLLSKCSPDSKSVLLTEGRSRPALRRFVETEQWPHHVVSKEDFELAREWLRLELNASIELGQ